MRRSAGAAFAAGVLLTAWAPGAPPARAARDLPLTHAMVLDSVAVEVAGDLLRGVTIPPGRPVAIPSPVPGDTLALVTQSLVGQLRAEGVEVRLTPRAGGAPPAEPTPVAGAAPDSADRPPAWTEPVLLDVQVDGSGVSYVRRVGKFPFGTKGYERLAAIRASATLVDPRTGGVLWSRSSTRRGTDLVPKDEVAYAASGSGKLSPPLPRGGSGRWLEPLIVVGVVVGLVVLFYSNRN